MNMNMTDNEYESIVPYNDEEVAEVLSRLSKNPFLPVVSKFFFPDQPLGTFRRLIKDIRTVDEFQEVVMYKVVAAVIERSMSAFTYDGLDNIDRNGTFLAVSNHRDIILDPALVQWTLYANKMPLTEICVGSNLLEGNRMVADLLHSNRMIKVIRGISARELYLTSRLLSKYIRETVTSGRSAIWIAQKEGRTKDGRDMTEQGLLKMFDMSGGGSFLENFDALHITPMSISYEYEPCDIRKARELLISRSRKYVKKKMEDTHSIMSGIKQWKGGVHLSIDKPLTRGEIEMASACDRNDRYQAIRRTLDLRIIRGYRLWKTNYMGYDLMNGSSKYRGIYDEAELEAFKAYTERKLSKVERSLDRNELRKIFWQIYGNPVAARERDLE